jgi:hypothetical protein
MTRPVSKTEMDQPEIPKKEQAREENWWEYCPICSSKLYNQKCRFICSNPRCSYFMSCSEFDM